MIGERLDNLGVGELEQARTLLDQDYAHAKSREHARVFDSDHAAAHHDQGPGKIIHLQDLVAVDDGLAVHRDFGRDRRLGSGRDDEGLRLVIGDRAGGAGDAQMRGIDKRAGAAVDVDAVARKLRLGDVDFGLDHVLDPEEQVRHRDLVLHAIVDAVDVLVIEAGEVQHGFAHGLARDGACVDADASDAIQFFDQRDFLSKLGALDGGSLPGRAGADDNQIVGLHPRRLNCKGLRRIMTRWRRKPPLENFFGQ